MPSLPAVPFHAALPALAIGVLSAGCLVGGQAARAPQPRDDELLSELRRQEKWAGEAAAGRASAEELKAAQAGDLDAQADLRQRFRKLLRAAERATWVREATPAALDGRGEAERAELAASFDKAARLRKEAWDAADEIAQDLCAIEGPSPLSLSDLRRGLATVRAAAQVEAKIAGLPAVATSAKEAPASAAPAKGAAAGQAAQKPADGAASGKEPRLAAAPAPVPKPFIEAAALLLEHHPAEEDSLRSFKPALAEEAALIKAALADLRAKRPPPDGGAAEGATPPGAAPPPAELESAPGGGEAGAAPSARTGPPVAGEERRIDLAGEARATLRRRGPPRAIVLRPDGSFVLRYDGPLRCPSPPCPPSIDLRFGKGGERLPDAPAAQGPGSGGAPAPAPPAP